MTHDDHACRGEEVREGHVGALLGTGDCRSGRALCRQVLRALVSPVLCPPLVLNTAAWRVGDSSTGVELCDLVAALTTAAFMQGCRMTQRDAEALAPITDTPLQDRLVCSALSESTPLVWGLPTRSMFESGSALGATTLVLSNPVSLEQVRTVGRRQSRFPAVAICNLTNERYTPMLNRGVLHFDVVAVTSELLVEMVGSAAKWLRSGEDSVHVKDADWMYTSESATADGLSIAHGPAHSVILRSTYQAASGTRDTLIVDLPNTVSLFLLEGSTLSPVKVRRYFGDVLPRHAGSAERPKTPAAGGIPKHHRARRSGSEDGSRHYDDDQWYDTESEKAGQDRRTGRAFTPASLGIVKQSRGRHGVSAATLQELLLRRGVAGRD